VPQAILDIPRQNFFEGRPLQRGFRFHLAEQVIGQIQGGSHKYVCASMHLYVNTKQGYAGSSLEENLKAQSQMEKNGPRNAVNIEPRDGAIHEKLRPIKRGWGGFYPTGHQE
jgi:hypothetical protein